MSKVVLENDGYCVVCEAPAHFASDDAWLRDHYRCQACGSLPRERALLTVLNQLYPEWRKLRIHESSPGLPSSSKLERECPGYVGTHYFESVKPGTTRWGYRCENLEAQTFSDESFDLVISQDVMEHVFDVEAAYREIARTLRVGGAHVFTTPIYTELEHSRTCARRNADVKGGIEHLEEPEYHGNPIDPQGSLLTIRYGRDIADLIENAAGTPTRTCLLIDAYYGLLGEFQEVTVSRKLARPDGIAPRAVAPPDARTRLSRW